MGGQLINGIAVAFFNIFCTIFFLWFSLSCKIPNTFASEPTK